MLTSPPFIPLSVNEEGEVREEGLPPLLNALLHLVILSVAKNP